MKRAVAALFLTFCLFLSNNALAQSGNASVGGFVQDATQAFIPGVMITATNGEHASDCRGAAAGLIERFHR